MKLAFHLGRVYTLSLAEILSVLTRRGVEYEITGLFTEILIIKTNQVLDVQSLQKRLGGTVKIMRVADELTKKLPDDYVNFTLKKYLTPQNLKKLLTEYKGKVQFGVSLYPLSYKVNLRNQNKNVGMDIKHLLQENGVSSRLVLPEGNSLALPSVAVTNNHLLEKGAEIDLLVSETKIYIAKTLTVQDFSDYGRRDYQRPIRDSRVGMLPPKVAQIMINLAQYEPDEKNKGGYILDPFVGSGTVLQEAMLIGFKVLGSDISQKAVNDAEKNLDWFRTRYKLPPHKFELEVADVGKISKAFPDKKPLAIITEGTLGPTYAKEPNESEMAKNFEELSKVYLSAFKEFKKILPKGRTVVMALPAYRVRKGYISFPVVDKILKLGYDIQDPISQETVTKYGFLKVTPRKSIIYDRKDQIVVREIIIFKVK
ncbi:MAG: hypothetical protein COT91_02220 [Candidatus Doudnabacteria bacterium CG10_big_fil_rev_8_21_14_0_10_41_10]|uniref:DNA methylase N-4/N-6 domain-containing protein n=1 Tax=Candidatus Doudnabacteria bacterium CG10_big_fil_rev_8_21_14_0_10_41_10 TaxID=1974551 RepID=A0A2H0VG55_9BACT|nr:MAG: hypothetical protein COT91_02220 [Candidatus Doudnabacteria bacterium CG10_big_fil_rev_8_21_14_0_10_41_10]